MLIGRELEGDLVNPACIFSNYLVLRQPLGFCGNAQFALWVVLFSLQRLRRTMMHPHQKRRDYERSDNDIPWAHSKKPHCCRELRVDRFGIKN